MYICYSYAHSLPSSSFFFFNDTATTEIYTLSLHDALPIYGVGRDLHRGVAGPALRHRRLVRVASDPRVHLTGGVVDRSEEHTSELQSVAYLVCRLLLEKKKNISCLNFEHVISSSIIAAADR